MFTTIIKRDGRTAAYDVEKIANAIFRAATSVGGKDYQTAYHLALQVGQRLEVKICSVTVSDCITYGGTDSGHGGKGADRKWSLPHCQRIHPLPRTAHPRA